MAAERKASDPRCVHGSWQGTYCPDCPANRAVFGAQRFLPSLTPPGERPEPDVLAAALADTPHSSSFVDQVSGARLGWLLLNERAKAHIRGEAEAILAALAARGYTLSKSAPDRPEPLLREALDDDGPVWTAGCPICAVLRPEGSARDGG